MQYNRRVHEPPPGCGTIYHNLTIFFFQAEDGIRDLTVTGVQTCALPIYVLEGPRGRSEGREDRGETQDEQQDGDEGRSEEHTSELQSQSNLVCRLLLEKKNKTHCFSLLRVIPILITSIQDIHPWS